MSLFLKLQKRVTELEQEKQVMQDELDRKEEQMLRSKAKVRGAWCVVLSSLPEPSSLVRT